MLRRLLLLLLTLLPVAAATAQRPVQIRLVRSADGSAYRFDPVEVTVREGDVIEFRVESGGPYVVTFEAADLSGPDQRQLSTALGDANGTLRSPTLTGPGQQLRVTVPRLRPGTYRFRSLAHVAYRMEGRLVVRPGGSSRAPE